MSRFVDEDGDGGFDDVELHRFGVGIIGDYENIRAVYIYIYIIM